MTQQAYPPQYPQQAPPAQQFPQPPAPQQPYPPQAYPQPGYPQQGYPPQVYPQQPPAQPLAQGNIDDFYSQPSAGFGNSVSWKDKPIGTTYAGIVARDVTNADIQQQTDPSTGAPKTFKDGRPQFVMKVPLRVQPSQEFPEGEATLFVRGLMRDELARAMSEVGVEGAPKGGDALQVQLVQRRPSRGGGNPANVFAIRYQSGQNGGQPAPQQQQAPQPQAPQTVDQTIAQQAATGQQPPEWAQPQPQGQPQLALPVQFPQPVADQGAGVQQQAPAPAPPVQQPQFVQQPQGQPPGAPQPPADLSPDQQRLLARLTQGQAG